MASRKKAATGGSLGVQLGMIVTPMLDMAFQILAFFIMTYHPSALEGHIPGSLAPPENFAKKSDQVNPNPTPMIEPPLSIPEENLLPELQEALQIRVKANVRGQVADQLEGTPSQVFIKTGIQTQETTISDGDVDFKTALGRISARLKEIAKEGNADKTNLKIAADADLRQQYVMQVYDVAKKANFKNIHFVPPPVLNSKIKLEK